MAEERFTMEESRNFAVLVARVWSDPELASQYERSPEAVLSGAGIALGGRSAPEIPQKPAELDSREMAGRAAFSSASSLSTVTCPCTGCTASCAGLKAEDAPQFEAMLKLADSPESRDHARKMTSSWGLSLDIHP